MAPEPPISRDELFKKIGYDPHSDAQWDFHLSKARFKINCSGRRWGKSKSCGNELTYRAFAPDTYWWIVGPTYALGEKEFRVLHENMVRKLGLHRDRRFKCSYNVKQGDMRMQLPWNTVIEVKSAEKQDSLVGEGLDGAIVSEAALHKSSTWEMYLEPALSDKRGEAWFPSTPRGYNWFKGLYDIGQDPLYSEYQSWRNPTWTNTAAYPGGRDDPEIKRIERVVSRTHFLQEYAAEFTAFEGQIYEDFDPSIHVVSHKYNPLWKNYWTFDFGFSDPFVCLDIQVDPSNNVYVWREYQVRHMSTFEHSQALINRRNPDGFRVDSMFGDPRGADELSTLALTIGQVWARPVGWKQGVEAVKRWMKLQPDGKPKLFIDRSCTELIRQIEQLRFYESRDGRNSPEKQHDWDDHGPDALRYFFNEYFVLGYAGSLSDMYKNHRMSEAATFFQNHTHVTLAKSGAIPY